MSPLDERWCYAVTGGLLLGLLLGFPGCAHSPHGTELASSPRRADTGTVVGNRDHQRRHHRRMHRRRGHHGWGRRRRTNDTQPERSDTTVESSTASTEADTVLVRGRDVYQKYCSSCHGSDREGDPPRTPSLQNVTDRLSRDDIFAVINEGRGRMPSFDYLSETDKNAVLKFLSEEAH